MKKQWLFAVWMVVVLLAGCSPEIGEGLEETLLPQPSESQPSVSITLTPVGTGASTETAVSPTPKGTSEPEVDSMTQPAPYDRALEPYVKQAKEDLSRRLPTLSVESIEVVEARTVVWPDAGLGCPQPGMRYVQVPVDGLLVQLRVNGQLYNYHGGGARGLFLCEGTRSGPKPTVPPLDPFLTPPASEN